MATFIEGVSTLATDSVATTVIGFHIIIFIALPQDLGDHNRLGTFCSNDQQGPYFVSHSILAIVTNNHICDNPTIM